MTDKCPQCGQSLSPPPPRDSLDDPVDLVGYLDRNPAERYLFIRRHGRDKFFELIRAAKQLGYRRTGR